MTTKRKKKKSWRDAFGPEETQQRVRPVESGEYLRNPHKGTTTFQRFNGDPLYPGLRWDDRTGPTEFKPFKGDPQKLRNRSYPRTTLSYCRWLWSVLEPEQGKYRWEIIEGALQAAAERGQTLQARVQPYITNDIPEWYWTNGGKVLTSASRGGVKVPDNNAPAYLELWGGFIRAFAARFDGHPHLESFDVAYAGPCGEMGGNCTPTVAAKLVDVYLHGFRKTQLVSMVGTHGCRYAAGLRGYRLGWRGDCFGDMRSKGRGAVPDGLTWNHMYDEYPEKVFTDGVQDAWKTAPVTLETCWVVGHWYNEGWDIDWILDWGLRYHASVFMPKSCAIPGEWADKVEAFNRRLGYRFILRQLMLPLETPRGKPFKIDVSLENGGVAPIYRPYALALRFRQGRTEEVVPLKVDVRTWLPGPTWFSERLKLPETLEPGEAKLDIGIIEPKTKKAVVRFAARGLLEDGWLPMTRIIVL
ncbi:MAG TPA: DUF4832 domain-containing protein [Planctomycetota bacterium]|nr:DUF4832 domain-containing protein [Planctomycetota bacterium]